jgi:hypothetical protein
MDQDEEDRKLFEDLCSEPLKVSHMFMHKEDFEDLLKFADHS